MLYRRWSILAMVLLLVIGLVSLFAYRQLFANEAVKRVSYYPAETDQVLVNPYMGFAVDANYDDATQPFSLAHANLTWRDIEPEKGKYAFADIEEKINLQLWKEKGVKLILRVVLDDPRENSHMDIPDWLYEEIDEEGKWYDTDYGKGFSPNYSHPVLIKNHERLINALAQRYNINPQIAFIELGSLGHWGEWHTKDDEQARISFPKRNIADQYAGHYVRYFSNKPLLMRRPHEIALQKGMGLFNDVFGDRESTIDEFLKWYTEGYTSWLTGEEEPAMPDFWTKAPSGGEFSSERTNYLVNARIEETLRQAKLTHVTWMGPKAPYDEDIGGDLQQNIDRFLKTIGYRFVIAKESHEMEMWSGGILNVKINVINRGVAPFYFPWTFELSLTDKEGTMVATTKTAIDIRKWLPGEKEVTAALDIPHGLPPGIYNINAAILDPETELPGVEFANDGKRADGRYTLGTVKVISSE